MIQEISAVVAVGGGLVVGGAGRWSLAIPVKLKAVRWMERELLYRMWVGLVSGLQKGAELLDIHWKVVVMTTIIMSTVT